MNISDRFKKSIKNTFYDKEITLYSSDEVIASDGWARRDEPSEVESINANVSFEALKKIQEDYGLADEISIMVTCELGSDITQNQIFSYNDQFYRCTDLLARDSHLVFFGEKWSSKSSTSISA